MFGFWHAASPEARRALLAASLGWLLDAFDVMLYALVLASLMSDLGMDRATGGLLGSITLAASAAGGILFGVIADRWGRTRALSLSILIYSVFTAACGFRAHRDRARDLPHLPRHWLRRGMGERRGAGVGNVAARASRQGPWPDAVVLGDRLRCGRYRHGSRPATVWLACGVLCRRAAGPLHTLDSPPHHRSRCCSWDRLSPFSERATSAASVR